MSETDARQPRMRRGVKIVLFLSLALNLLVAGLVVGAVVGHRFGPDTRPPHLERAGGPMTAALSRADRRAIGLAMRAATRGKQPSPAEIRAEYQGVIDALTATPYDATAVRAALERQLGGLNRRAELGKEMLLQRLDEMNQAERAAYAERLEQVLDHRRNPAPKGRRGPGL